MSDNVVNLNSLRSLARDTLIEVLRENDVLRPDDDATVYAVRILAALWNKGWKIVPVE